MNPVLPRVIPRSQHTVSRRRIATEALTVLYRLKRHGYLGFLAGGGVRDLLIGRQPKDFDIATDATPELVRRLFRRCRLVGRRFRLAHVLFPGGFVEVATFRATAVPDEETETAGERVGSSRRDVKEVVSRGGMIVRDNAYGTPAEDAVRRDFTVNALFYDIRDFSVVDYVNGLDDLRHGLIRSIGAAEIRFVEDPVRMLRAVRLAATLDFAIDADCKEAMQRHYARLGLANRYRLFDEWLKIIDSGALARMGRDLLDTRLLSVLLPDFARWLDAAQDGRRQRFELACIRLDKWRRNTGKPVPVDLALAILLGEYFETLIAGKTVAGMPWFPAAMETVSGFLASCSLPMALPRSVVQGVARLMAVQDRFQPGGGRRSRFREQAVFVPALEVFRFLCEAQQRPREWLAAWENGAPPAVRRRRGKKRRKKGDANHATGNMCRTGPDG